MRPLCCPQSCRVRTETPSSSAKRAWDSPVVSRVAATSGTLITRPCSPRLISRRTKEDAAPHCSPIVPIVLQKRERRLKGRCQALRRRGGQPQTVRTDGPRGEVTELDQILRGHLEHFAATVKLRDGRRGNRVGHVGPVCQPAEYAGIDENSHYS